MDDNVELETEPEQTASMLWNVLLLTSCFFMGSILRNINICCVKNEQRFRIAIEFSEFVLQNIIIMLLSGRWDGFFLLKPEDSCLA